VNREDGLRAAALLLCLSIGVTISSGCDRTVYLGDPLYIISGHVYDSNTGSPLESAIISAPDTVNYAVADTSDSAGRFTLSAMLLLPADFHCQKSGYLTTVLHVPRPSIGNSVTSAAIYLRPE